MLPTTSQHSNGSLGSRDAARHTAGAKRYKYLRRLLHFRQMDFEFALWQMLYLFTSPQRVYRNFHYRKQTKDQWARDDPAFLVLLSIWLCVSTIGFGLVLDMGVLETLKLLLWVVFVDCIGVGLLISTLMWVISNKYLLKHPSREFDVEWGYAFDVHLNAFYPLLVILHFLQLFFINHVIVIKSDWFLGYFVGNTLWLIAIGYYLYITFLGYNGSTWTTEIVDQLLHNGDVESCRRAPITVRTAFLEATDRVRSKSGLHHLKEMVPPRVIKTHLPIQMVPVGFWEKKCKTIYVARNAKDTVVSFYYFHQMNLSGPEPGPWESFVHKFMHGELAWGCWHDHVKGFWEEQEKRDILYLFYEDLKENPRREVERIMKYLDLSLSDDVISRIVELTTFKNMKENPMANFSFFPSEIYNQSISKFLRKGEVGDWKNHFTPEQSAAFDEDYEKKMKQANIPFKTEL